MAIKQKVSHQCLFRVQSPIIRSSVSLLSWHRIDSEWTQWTLFIPVDPPYSYPPQCWDRAAASTASAIKISTVYNFGFANCTQKHTHGVIQAERSSSPPCVLRCTLWSLILSEWKKRERGKLRRNLGKEVRENSWLECLGNLCFPVHGSPHL